MIRQLSIIAGAIITIGLMIGALWAWQNASALSDDALHSDIQFWAIRCGALGAAALAQLALLTLVVDQIYRRGAGALIVRLTAGLVSTLAIVAAVALALAGRSG